MTPLVIPVVAALAILLSQMSPPPDRVILLPDADGKVGQVVVHSSASTQVLDKAYAASEIDAKGNIAARNEDPASVHARYGALLDARPPRPVSFTVNFVSGSAQELTPESKPVFEQLKTTIASRPAPEISVIGHTDRVGNLEANDALSLKRAEAVRSLLQEAGIQAVMEVAGRGEREPLVATADEVEEAANRRVEINLR
ncbi:OmpA family protein [Propionivibrio sp.]|uniref:OmpA family protein n=1 Tax=Propionivibrio sp. TaxID=2212460 RepID=UPI003BF3E0D9